MLPRVSTFTRARLRISFALAAKWSVDIVSCADSRLGLMLAMMVVRELPPSESCSSRQKPSEPDFTCLDRVHVNYVKHKDDGIWRAESVTCGGRAGDLG